MPEPKDNAIRVLLHVEVDGEVEALQVKIARN